MTEAFRVARLSRDPAGESHFDDYDVDRMLQKFAPPSAPFFVSRQEAAAGYVVVRLPAGWTGEPHPSPHRQILFAMSGAFRVTASDGSVRTIRPGEGFLMEDTGGKGHRSEVVSDEPFDAVIILLGDAQ